VGNAFGAVIEQEHNTPDYEGRWHLKNSISVVIVTWWRDSTCVFENESGLVY
tara:strand:+ start:763 stop:918 length:156 start_codon:yes stop_codon:yes gene_type:complete